MHQSPLLASIPRIALIGRRNVGKSSLLNALCRRRYAITDKSPGLTRDILEVELKHNNLRFFLSDTPGLDIESTDELSSKIKTRTQDYLESVDLIVLLLEAPYPHPFDLDLISFIRKAASQTPLIFAVNKIDNEEKSEELLLPFYEAKLSQPIPISARGRWNLGLLLKRIEEKLEQQGADAGCLQNETIGTPGIEADKKLSKKEEIPVAIVGRPNAGKSSLFNYIVGEERALVSEVPGTTRDSLDTKVNYKQKDIRIIDTAGMRKASRLLAPQHRVEFYSLSRTRRSIREAKVVILVVDGLVGLTDFDKRICSMIQKYKCAVIFAISKWDAVKQKYEDQSALKSFQERINFLFPHIRDLPLIYCSALTGHGIKAILDMVLELHTNMKFQISTSKLNTLFQKWYMKMPNSGRNLKIFYATQTAQSPPEFVLFVNQPRLFSSALSSYFMNSIRKQFRLKGIPFALYARKRT